MSDNTIQINRIHKVDGDTKLKAFVDVSFGAVVVKGLKVVDGSNGMFVSMPRHQGKDGKWYDTVFPVNDELRKEINELVLAAYNE